MKRYLGGMIVGLMTVSVAALGCMPGAGPGPGAGAANFNMVGTWSGSGLFLAHGIYVPATITHVITSQNGSLFYGTRTWQIQAADVVGNNPAGQATNSDAVAFVGVIGDNGTIYERDHDPGIVQFLTIVNANTLSLSYTEGGAFPVTGRVTLTRQP